MTRKLRWLVAVPVATVGLYFFALLVGGDGARDAVIRGGIVVSKAMALGGALLAALTFERGEHMRRAWLLVAVCSALLLMRDALLIPALAGLDPIVIPWIRSALAVVANACAVVGFWYLANAWSIAGVELPGSRLSRRGLVIAAIVIAVAVVGPTTWLGVQEVLAGNARAVARVASGIADSIQLALLAPVLLTAAALRGGLLSWIFGFLAAGQFAWLFYDALSAYSELVLTGGAGLLAVTEMFRILANSFTLSGGLAQRSVVLAARGDAPATSTEARP
jgi:hypothetical protein